MAGSAVEARADDFRVSPYAALRQEYNDNIFFAFNNEEDDFITTATGGIDLKQRTERLTALLNARLDGLAYADNSDLNDIEEFYSGEVHYDLTQSLTVSGEAKYTVDTRPDRDIETTGLVLNTEERRRQNYTGSADYRFSERDSFFASYSYGEDQYATNTFNDYNDQNVLVGYTRSLALTKPTTLRFYGQYSDYDFSRSTVENYRFTVGVSRNVSEKFNYVLDIGPRFTKATDDITGDTSHDNGAGGRLSLTYNEELTRFNLDLYHEISGSSSRSSAMKRTGLNAAVRYRLAERSRIGLTVDSFLNKADRDTAFVGDLDEMTTSVSPSLHYEFTRRFSCTAAYRYTIIDDRENDRERSRHVVFVKLNYEIPVVE